MKFDLAFFRGKNVLVTGHTGFKGTWLCKVLCENEANVVGYSLIPNTKPSLYEMISLDEQMISIEGDIRNLSHLEKVFREYRPEIVIHLAAQPIVRESYKEPVYTYETNVMGTVNILECIRKTGTVKSFLNVTTDKVYLNREWEWGYRENEELNGYDPYSNSKSCSELVTSAYNNSFLQEQGIAVSTARAGNVIGGGDFAKDRIIPDCVRAVRENRIIEIRNPNSVRPYQHVLEPIFAYLMIAALQYQNIKYAGNYNIGPDETDCWSTGKLVEQFVKTWGENLKWKKTLDEGPHEANYLKLDCSKIKQIFNWKPTWTLEEAVDMIVEWNKEWLNKSNIEKCMERQIQKYINECEWYGQEV